MPDTLSDNIPGPAPFCSGQEEIIYLWLDGELPASERTAFAAHLQTCQSCQALLREAEALFASLAGIEPLVLPSTAVAEAAAEIMAKLPAPEVSRPPSLVSQLILAGQMMVDLILLLMILPRLLAAYAAWLPDISGPKTLELFQMLVKQLAMLNDIMMYWIPEQGPRISDLSLVNTNLPPTLALIMVTFFGLAWVLSNTLLLGHKIYSLKIR